MRINFRLTAMIGAAVILSAPTFAQSFNFSTGPVTDRIATASRPESAGKIEIESADDFIIGGMTTFINNATFTGLIPTGANIHNVRVEIYRVFPSDSDVGRTSGAPTFSTPQVPTRVNSPSDVAFADRDAITGNLTFTTNLLSPSFTASNSILNGIHPKPNQNTNGEGPVTGQEVEFNVHFSQPFLLPADHYFFIPQVELDNGDFFWLSGSRPIVAPGTPILPDLQSWIRNANLDPDWLRIGTDIVGGSPAPTFNGAFSLNGQAVPEPGSIALFAGASLTGTALLLRRRSRRK